jgi:hypothetical protein
MKSELEFQWGLAEEEVTRVLDELLESFKTKLTGLRTSLEGTFLIAMLMANALLEIGQSSEPLRRGIDLQIEMLQFMLSATKEKFTQHFWFVNKVAATGRLAYSAMQDHPSQDIGR